MNKVIAVDFDGTLCVSQWPEIGEENYGLIEWLKECRSKGDKVILFTCREDDLLDAAVKWCAERGLRFDAVNANLPERVARYGGDCRKISADIYLDDRAIGVFYPPKQSSFYVQGTKGMFMRAAVELNTDEEYVTKERIAKELRERQREIEQKERLKAAGIIPPLPQIEHKEGRAVIRPLEDDMRGYQYTPPKKPLSIRIREAWRVLRGRKA